ncbi:alanine racemase, partial [bacterium]|nr:alanine racemase [bacterium]
HSVHLHGRYVPIIGNVCMDLTMIDITDVSAAELGDDVELFGKKVDIRSLAKINNTIPYELLAGISTRVKKVYVRS